MLQLEGMDSAEEKQSYFYLLENTEE